MNSIFVAIAISLTSTAVLAEAIYEEFPSQVSPGEKYVIYSHGLIVEGTNETPTHPKYGIYDFPSIRQEIFEIGGFNLIAHHRPKNTNIGEYVDLLESWVISLMKAGIDSNDITLIGFSRGAFLTVLASNKLQSFEINTILMASCFNGDIAADPPISLGGRLLSIYETTDTAGHCGELASRSQLRSFDEISITTGKKHGAFYTPHEYWLNPIKEWLQRNDS